MELSELLRDFTEGLYAADQSGVAHKDFQPGIGPFGEADAVKASLLHMKQSHGSKYAEAVTKRQPDLLIPGVWQIEIKVVRPFGDNGREAESWSQNLLHPYRGNTSSLGDCLKLLDSKHQERRAILVFGFEHDVVRKPVEPCIRGFEILAGELFGVRLSHRLEEVRTGLRHPVHQVLRAFAWEVLSTTGDGVH